jgi:putative protease
LELNSETKKSLLEKKETLPFSKKQVYISLDPFCPQEIEKDLISTIEQLVEQGFRYWVVNNPAHINMLRGKKATMIAGPYLYTFNRWAASWLENQNIENFITPIENSRKNLEATFEGSLRKKVMITLFSYPALFRMRFQLPESYDFTYFKDKEGTEFKTLSTEDGSFVMPEKPFSIIDNMQKMMKLGFSHFLLDFSRTQVDKSEFRYIMKALFKGDVLPETFRFNWKDGFYSPEKMEERRLAQERASENPKGNFKGGKGNRKGGHSKKSFNKKR